MPQVPPHVRSAPAYHRARPHHVRPLWRAHLSSSASPPPEPPLTTCDRCGGPIHRLLSATPFILKGGGWYVTDYPSESRKQASKAESSSSDSAAPSSTPAAEKSSTSTAASSHKAKPAKPAKAH